MGCIKCGRDVSEGALFCDRCLEGMEEYPVPINAVITLPKRRESSRSVAWQPAPSQSEQIAGLKKTRRNLAIIILVLLVLVGGLIWSTLSLYKKTQAPKPGQNYSSMETTASTEPGETD